MKPFFKFSGGKRKELKVVEDHLPESYDTFYEPFIGGGAVWLCLQPEKAVINDNYEELINFYRVLEESPEDLVSEINRLSKEYGAAVKEIEKDPELEAKVTALKAEVEQLAANSATSADDLKRKKVELKETKREMNAEWYKLADRYYYYYRNTNFTSDFMRAIKFYLMRQLSFSGMLRFSSNGKFNIPYGWYKSFKGVEQDIDDIKKVFENTRIDLGHWKDSVAQATSDDFVFLDPPYTRVFTDYHPAGAFHDKEHRELAEWFRTTDAKVMIIINKDEFTEELYGDFIKCEYGYRYAVQYRDRMTEADSNAVHIVACNYDLTES